MSIFSTTLQQSGAYPNNVSAQATDLTPYNGPWTAKEVVHLLRRTMFGAAKADVDYFLSQTMSSAVDELLTPAPAPAPPLNNYNTSGYTDPDVPFGQTWVNAGYGANLKRRASFKSWWTGLMLNQNRSIHEKMTLFWHNHFPTETTIVDDSGLVYKNNSLLRQNALGNFKTLTLQVTLDPAMLIYLNGYLNTAGAPDENYGRELQELFTVGKDPSQLFSEDDVKAAAAVLTGYSIDFANSTYIFYPSKHNAGDKQFSAFYNNTLISGQAGAAGRNELDDLLNMIFATQKVAEFICKKIYRYFVYYQIDSTVDANIIQPLATIFRSNNYDILPVLSALFKSQHFFDMLNRGCVIKSPMDYFVGACREFNVQFPAASNLADQYYFWNLISTEAALVNQDIADPPNVAGWPAYYQSPSYHEVWINTATLPKRAQFADIAINGGFTQNGFTLQFDPIAFVAKLSNPADPNSLISETLDLIFSIDTGTTLYDYLKSILLSGQVSDSYWTSAWKDYVNDPSDPVALSTVKTRLTQFFQYLLDLAEYQLS